jgi:hypothetical protein
MSVFSTAYSIPPEMMEKIRADNTHLHPILGIFEYEDPSPEFEAYRFSSRIRETMSILKYAGYEKTAVALDGEGYVFDKGPNYINYEGLDVWFILPSEIKAISEELEKATFEALKAEGLAQGVRDYNCQTIPESAYLHYVGDIEAIKVFFKKAASLGHYLVFEEG